MTGATERPSNELTHGAPAGRDIVIVTFDSGQILDVTGPLEVFSSASRFLPEVRYRTRVVTTRGGSVRANCGLEFASSAIGDVVGPVDTLVVAGGSGMDQAVTDTELLDQIRRLAADARRVTSVCSGAFLLAAGDYPLGRLRSAGDGLRRGQCGSRRHLRPGRQRVDLRGGDRGHRPGPRA